jgi:hypothetical protein
MLPLDKSSMEIFSCIDAYQEPIVVLFFLEETVSIIAILLDMENKVLNSSKI